MKKLATLLLAASMVVAASAPASAVDVKMDGEYVFTFITGERMGSGDNFDGAGQRFRLGMTFTASEDLSGYLQLQAGIGAEDDTIYDWGTSNNAKSAPPYSLMTDAQSISFVLPSLNHVCQYGSG